MTLDDLVKIFEEGSFNPEHPFADHDLEKGIRAVVKALRDESYACDHGEEWLVMLDEILASEGAHGSPELDEDARKLEAMGQDAGPTVQDLFPEVFAPAAAYCHACLNAIKSEAAR